jgi:hypothetical protein
MIASTIFEKITNGELIEINVSATPGASIPQFEGEVREMQTWLRQFNKSCGPHRCIYFSEKSNSRGDVTAEVTIGVIPDNRREEIKQKLKTLADNAPFEITLRTINP